MKVKQIQTSNKVPKMNKWMGEQKERGSEMGYLY